MGSDNGPSRLFRVGCSRLKSHRKLLRHARAAKHVAYIWPSASLLSTLPGQVTTSRVQPRLSRRCLHGPGGHELLQQTGPSASLGVILVLRREIEIGDGFRGRPFAGRSREDDDTQVSPKCARERREIVGRNGITFATALTGYYLRSFLLFGSSQGLADASVCPRLTTNTVSSWKWDDEPQEATMFWGKEITNRPYKQRADRNIRPVNQ